jgi:hypothetical protein
MSAHDWDATTPSHVSRRPHPSDRRSITITATPGADEEVRHTLGQMHERMLAAAASLDKRQADVVGHFLSRLPDTSTRREPLFRQPPGQSAHRRMPKAQLLAGRLLRPGDTRH